MTDSTDSSTRLAERRGVRYGCALVAIVFLVTTPVAATAGTAQATDSASQLPAEPAFVVELHADGSARATLAMTFDLTTESEREAFEALRANTTAREQRTDRFATRLQAIAAGAENASGRSMQIRDPGITFATRNDTGIVALSVTWEGLAAQEGDQLVLQEPFTSGFDLDRSFRIHGPDGYELATVRPSPTTQTQTSATWRAGTALDGFQVTFTAAGDAHAAETGNDESSAGAPGFGIGVGAVALLVSTALLLYRRRS
ncbi:PGF-CTERM sorting domain-containing protein [Halomarina halobia]|uniref:PGF-CTERM sorting domain-containing protein n=1 Tax=Halomarina halobia TaxID=3033386 RepID=A0ABD6ABW9_9EURY|nr:hypothetical protein [Halomarina sp. PSR21]